MHVTVFSINQMCSTPYGNQRKITGYHGRGFRRWIWVLNALRQSEENHGIPLSVLAPDPQSAQRLTAIRGKSLNRQTNKALRAECSTPYGNQRKITWKELEEEPSDQQCSTPYGNQRKITGHGIGRVPQPARAQRLTAIRGKSHSWSRQIGASPLCAQRLTAIRGKSPAVAS